MEDENNEKFDEIYEENSEQQGSVAIETEEEREDVDQPDEEPQDDIELPSAEEIERRIAEQNEQDQRLLNAIDEALERRNINTSGNRAQEHVKPSTRVVTSIAKRGIGFVSLGFILIFLGIVMIVSLCAPVPNYTLPLKLSPVCAIIIGVEIVITRTLSRGRARINIPSLVISVLLVAGCCILFKNLAGNFREETVEYNNRTIAGEIYERSYEKLKDLADIRSIKVDVNLNPDGDGKLHGVDALSSSDEVDVSVVFGGYYESPKYFVWDCRKIIEGYRLMGIHITNFHFQNKSTLRSYSLDLEGKFAQDLDESALEEAVNYVFVDDQDYIEDLEDYVESEDSDDTSDDDGN